MEKKYYIYAHINPVKNEIFYIGKGTGKRAYWKHKRSNFWNAIRNRYGMVVDILEEGLTESEALEREIWYINRIGRRDLGKGPLVNLTDGGDNPPSHKGKKKSEETKMRMREGNKNRKASDETRKILSKAQTGKKQSEETVKKRALAMTKYFTEEERKEANRLAQVRYRNNKKLITTN